MNHQETRAGSPFKHGESIRPHHLSIASALISLAAPAFAKGGGSDIQFEREKLQAEREQTNDKSAQTSPSLFDLFFGGDKKPEQKSK